MVKVIVFFRYDKIITPKNNILIGNATEQFETKAES